MSEELKALYMEWEKAAEIHSAAAEDASEKNKAKQIARDRFMKALADEAGSEKGFKGFEPWQLVY